MAISCKDCGGPLPPPRITGRGIGQVRTCGQCIGKKISRTKLSPEGNIRLRAAYEKCKERLRESLRGRVSSNKCDESELTKKECLKCGSAFIVVPSKISRQFCGKTCRVEYRRGKRHVNFNRNSIHGKSGRGVSGEYYGVPFRSTYELSFLVKSRQLGYAVKFEPVRILMSDFMPEWERRQFGVKDWQVYVPDYMVNDEMLIEIKPEKMTHPESQFAEMVWAKIIVLGRYCKKNGLGCHLMTDEYLGENILNDKQIRALDGVVFYRKIHQEKYAQTQALEEA